MAITGTRALSSLQPELYRSNAFRVAGIDVEASPIDFRRRLETLQVMEKVGMQTDASSGGMALTPSPPAATIRVAIDRLADPEQRLLEEFFWFWPLAAGTAKRDPALRALQQNDVESALAEWQRRCGDSTDEVALHNLAVSHHVMALDSELAAASDPSHPPDPGINENWGKAWKYWRLLREHGPFWERLKERIREMDDPRVDLGSAFRIQAELQSWLGSINAQLAFRASVRSDSSTANRHLELLRLSGLDEHSQIRLLERALQPARDSLKTLCAHADTEGRADAANSDKPIGELLEAARPILRTFQELLPPGNSIRDGAHDQVAGLLRSLLVGFGNASKSWRFCRETLTECYALATGASVRSQIEEDLKTVNENLEAALCWFCGKNDPYKKRPAVVPMHGDIETTYQGAGRQYRWNIRKIEVPRCRSCRRVHIGRRFILAVTLGIAPAVVFWSDSIIAIISTITAFIGWQVAPFFRIPPIDRLLGSARTSIRPERHKQKFPAVGYLQSQGWSLGSKPSEITGNSNVGLIEGKTWLKGVTWVGVLIALIFFFSALQDNFPTEHQSGGESSSSYEPTTSTSTAARPTPSSVTSGAEASGDLPGTSSGTSSYEPLQDGTGAQAQALKVEIESSRTRLQQLNALVDDCSTTIDSYKDQLSRDKQTLERMASDNEAGLDVDKSEYEIIRSRHNRYVRLYNDKIQECRPIAQQHDDLVDETNAKIHEYNRLIGAR